MADLEQSGGELAAIERSFAVQDALVSLVQTAEAQALALEQQAVTRHYLVDSCLHSCLAAVDIAFLRQDKQQAQVLSESSWQPPIQPQPSAVDSWVRGTLEVKQQRKAIAPSPLPEEGRLSRQGIRPPGPASRAPSVRNGPGPGSVVSSQGGRARRMVSEAPSSQRSIPTLVKSVSQQELEERLREEVDIRRRFQQKTLEQHQVQEQEQRRLDDLHKTLRGKEYSYDCKGQVIVLTPVDVEALPATATLPAVTILAPEDTTKARKGKAGDKAAGEAVSKAKPKSYSLAGSVPEFVEDKKETQPPILDSLKPAPGVTLKQGAQVKKGPRPVNTLAQLTRKDFARYMAKASRLDASELMRTATAAPVEATPGPAPPAPLRSAAPPNPPRTTSMSAPNGPAEAGTGADAGSSNSFSAALRVTSDDPAQADWVKRGVHRPPSVPVESGANLASVDLANLALTSATDWGANTASKHYEPPPPMKASMGKSVEPFLPLRQRMAPQPHRKAARKTRPVT